MFDESSRLDQFEFGKLREEDALLNLPLVCLFRYVLHYSICKQGSINGAICIKMGVGCDT